MKTNFKNYHSDKKILLHLHKLLHLRCYDRSLIHLYCIPISTTEKSIYLKVPVKESRRSCLVNLKACSSFYQAGLSNMNYFTGFAKAITFLFYIF